MTEVAIVGAGLMGHAFAVVFALGGHKVRITDNNAATLQAAPGLMEQALATLIEGKEIDATWTPARLREAVTCCGTLAETVAGAALVLEAIVEVPEAKQRLYEQLVGLVRPDAIVASNTSYLDVFPLVPAALRRRFLIVHGYTPPYLVDLVDIVGGPETDPEVIETVRDLVAAMGKVPIVLRRFVSGYIANRIQSAITQEVYRLLDDGVATPREIDDAIIHGLSLRLPILGHLAKADFTSLELIQRTLKNAAYDVPKQRDHSETLDALLAEGRSGVMAGRGFFDWGNRSPAELFRDRDLRLIALKQAMRKIGPLTGN